MDQTSIAALAKAIVDKTILSSWQLYALLAAITFVFSALGAFAGKYLGKRGEALATKADFGELQRQLKESTRLTEQIKGEVKQIVERAERWHWLRREKL